MYFPSFLTKSGSSTPATCTLVVEWSADPMDWADSDTPFATADSATAARGAMAISVAAQLSPYPFSSARAVLFLMYSRISSAELNFLISPVTGATTEPVQPAAMMAATTRRASTMRGSVLRDMMDQ